jgi:hypothetical protein
MMIVSYITKLKKNPDPQSLSPNPPRHPPWTFLQIHPENTCMATKITQLIKTIVSEE